MAINPQCDSCNEDLNEFGAILLSPPDSESKVIKFHICVECYKHISLMNHLEKNLRIRNSKQNG